MQISRLLLFPRQKSTQMPLVTSLFVEEMNVGVSTAEISQTLKSR